MMTTMPATDVTATTMMATATTMAVAVTMATITMAATTLPEMRVFMALSKRPIIATTMQPFIGAIIGCFESHK
jgi:hypothetical protein